jgi:hypothetical protein
VSAISREIIGNNDCLSKNHFRKFEFFEKFPLVVINSSQKLLLFSILKIEHCLQPISQFLLDGIEEADGIEEME